MAIDMLGQVIVGIAGAGALAIGGTIAMQAHQNSAAEREKRRIAGEQRRKEEAVTLAAQRAHEAEVEAKREAERALAERATHNARVERARANPQNFIDGERDTLMTGPDYTDATIRVERTAGVVTEAQGQVATVETRIPNSPIAIGALGVFWIFTLVATLGINLGITSKVIGGIEGVGLAFGMAVFSTTVMILFRHFAFDRFRSKDMTFWPFIQACIIVVVAAVIYIVLMTSFAGARAESVYGTRIDNAALYISDLMSTDGANQFDIQQAQALLENLKEQKTSAEKFYQYATPLILVAELAGAFFAAEFISMLLAWRTLPSARRRLQSATTAHSTAEDTVTRLENAWRNRLIPILIEAGIYTDARRAQLGYELPEQPVIQGEQNDNDGQVAMQQDEDGVFRPGDGSDNGSDNDPDDNDDVNTNTPVNEGSDEQSDTGEPPNEEPNDPPDESDSDEPQVVNPSNTNFTNYYQD
jgi:hypothetical protein